MQPKLIVGMSGSTTKKSYNTALLRAFGDQLPSGINFHLIQGLELLPFYSPDLDGPQIPDSAKELRDLVSSADALVISSPEYNYSYTSLIKNALDWLSRPYGNHALVNKPVALLGASQGLLGAIRAQLHLRDVLHATESDVIVRPEIFVTQAASKFDENMMLIDPSTRLLLDQMVTAVVTHVDVRSKRTAA